MAEKPLAGRHIVVTRPREQAADLAKRIKQVGGKPLLFPLLEIKPVEDVRALHGLAKSLTSYDLLIFISPNAVKHGMASLGTLPRTVRAATVGQGSARALRDAGVADIIVPGGSFDSEALLAMPEMQNVSGWRIAILRGDAGRELLGDTLKQRGANVEYVACYQRSKAPFDSAGLLDVVPDAISITSSEALAHLCESYDEARKSRLTSIPLFVPHPRIAEAAQRQGWRQVIITGSGDDGLMTGLIAWAQAKRN
ncbi:MAG: uroporphyrinogen-III synthase [Gammaproteobacteria bacterium]|nr:uroporphyrinogen-III synthase [Gammaproteobacteria bacterium]MBU1775921.1 uroporphyrinogen-III synthase [Gammaproteobacteria bacterium]MBU1968152.1 uroporphyrinogen-III synthase [Gammaproteobacteria bacterium]